MALPDDPYKGIPFGLIVSDKLSWVKADVTFNDKFNVNRMPFNYKLANINAVSEFADDFCTDWNRRSRDENPLNHAELKLPNELSCVENPPVAIVVIAWAVASKLFMPAIKYNIAQIIQIFNIRNLIRAVLISFWKSL